LCLGFDRQHLSPFASNRQNGLYSLDISLTYCYNNMGELLAAVVPKIVTAEAK
jgi:hypothetical protein